MEKTTFFCQILQLLITFPAYWKQMFGSLCKICHNVFSFSRLQFCMKNICYVCGFYKNWYCCMEDSFNRFFFPDLQAYHNHLTH